MIRAMVLCDIVISPFQIVKKVDFFFDLFTGLVLVYEEIDLSL